jgi:hypothetical protein
MNSDSDIEIFNQWLLGNYPDIKALEYFQWRLRSETGDGFIDMASAKFCDTVLNNKKRQQALDDLGALENEASQKMEECLREGKPDEYNKYMATDYKAAMLVNPLNAIKKAEYLKSILVKNEEKIEYLKNCIAEINKVMVSKKLHDNTNRETGGKSTNPSEIINEIANNDSYFGFNTHAPYLVEKGYFEAGENCLIWKKGGAIMMAAYFGMLQEHHNPMKKCKWAPIEKVFKVYIDGKFQHARNLSQQYKDFEEVKKCRSEKHDKEYKELKALIEGKIKE